MLVTGRKIKSYCFLTLILCGLIKGVRYLKPISCEKHIHVKRVIVARLEIEGGGTLFLEEKALWPDGKYVTTHLVVSKGYLAGHQETVKKLIAGLLHAIHARAVSATPPNAARLIARCHDLTINIAI